MGFRFYPIQVTCNETLSSPDSDWGANDGIRLYVLLTTSGGFSQLMVSGRELPPPDDVDTYVFAPGTQLQLNKYPPQGAANWRSDDFVLGSTDIVTIVLMGINEGLQYIEGGGGGEFQGSAPEAGLLEAQKTLGGQLAAEAAKEAKEAAELAKDATSVGDAASAAVSDGIFAAFNDLISQINAVPDCRGVAFAHGISFDRKTLLAHTLTATGFQFQPPLDEVGLATELQSKQGCGRPDYDVLAYLWRTFDLALGFTQTKTASRALSQVMPFEPQGTICKPASGASLLMYLEGDDYETDVIPTVWYPECSPYWTINGVGISRVSGTVEIPASATRYILQGDVWTQETSEQQVTLTYEQLQDPDGTSHLILKTSGADGNYALNVTLNFNFEGSYVGDNQLLGDISVAATDIYVPGQVWTGNAEYLGYLACLERFFGDLTRRLSHLVIRTRLGPPTPGPRELGLLAQQVEAFGRQLEQLGEISELTQAIGNQLQQIVKRIGGQAGAPRP